ncbi:hypothetical protein SHO565_38720 [Streptomyces sp. HO565]
MGAAAPRNAGPRDPPPRTTTGCLPSAGPGGRSDTRDAGPRDRLRAPAPGAYPRNAGSRAPRHRRLPHIHRTPTPAR